MRLEFEREAWEDLNHWAQKDRRMLLRVLGLIEASLRDPFGGIGKPEPLKHQLKSAWSRRVDQEHRLIYRVEGGVLIVMACRLHY